MERAAHLDRLSALPDATLARVLSHLVTDEATRTSALSRRWCRVYAAVPVIHLVDRKVGDVDRNHFDKIGVAFDQQVTSALLCRDPTTPIRTFRLNVLRPTPGLLDQWILTVLLAGAEEIDVHLRYSLDSSRRKLCPFRGSTADFKHDKPYLCTPRHLFRSATLRHMCLTHWTLSSPPDVSLGSLETLYLKKILARHGALQRLISGCPRLTDLTLEECPSVTDITVTSAHLRSFAMTCCHHARSVVLEASSLRSLHYEGGLPHSSFFSLASYAGVVAVTVVICQDLAMKNPPEVAPVKNLISQCTHLTYLRLSLRPSMAYYSNLFARALCSLPLLRELDLQGSLPNDHALQSVADLLQATNNLEVLSLFSQRPELRTKYDSDREVDSDWEVDSDFEQEGRKNNDDIDYRCNVHVPKSLLTTPIRCLTRRVRRINLVKYTGCPLERMLAKFLLSKAAVLEKFSVTFAPRSSEHKDELISELSSWRLNQHTDVTCA